MRTKFTAVAFLAVLLSGNVLAADKISQEKQALVDTLLEQTGQSANAVAGQFSTLFIQQMSMMLKNSNPNIPQRALEILEEEVTNVINETFVESGAMNQAMYPVYDKHFSTKELEEMIAFNNTPLGQKLIQVMPQITQDGMMVGQQLGQQLGPMIQQRLAERFREEGIN